jgi:integrase
VRLHRLEGKTPFGPSTWQKRRLDALRDKRLGDPVEPFVRHDLRRSARTRLRAVKVPVAICDRVLGHTLPPLLRVYDRGEALDERRDALAKLERHVLKIIGRRT